MASRSSSRTLGREAAGRSSRPGAGRGRHLFVAEDLVRTHPNAAWIDADGGGLERMTDEYFRTHPRQQPGSYSPEPEPILRGLEVGQLHGSTHRLVMSSVAAHKISTVATTVDRAAAGDHEAFARLIADHHGDMMRVAHVITGIPRARATRFNRPGRSPGAAGWSTGPKSGAGVAGRDRCK